MQSDLQEANREKTLGNECFSAKNYHQAIKHFTKAIDLNPEDHVFYSNRSACYANLEEYDKALVDAQICCDINPTWAKGYLRRGLAEFYLKKYEQAEKTYKEGLKLEPGNQQLVEGLQRVQETRKSQPEASGFDKEKFFQEAVTQLKSNPETSAFFEDKEFVEKINEIKSNPQKAALYMNDPKIQKAFEVIKAGYGKGAAAGSNTAGASGKQKAGATAEEEKTRGNEEFQKKNFEAAIYHYDKAIELNPSEPTYYNNKAAVYLELKNPRKVIESCDKAVSLFREQGNPDKAKLAKALSRKAAAFALEQDFDEAIKYYKESLKEKDDPIIREEIKRLSQS